MWWLHAAYTTQVMANYCLQHTFPPIWQKQKTNSQVHQRFHIWRVPVPKRYGATTVCKFELTVYHHDDDTARLLYFENWSWRYFANHMTRTVCQTLWWTKNGFPSIIFAYGSYLHIIYPNNLGMESTIAMIVTFKKSNTACHKLIKWPQNAIYNWQFIVGSVSFSILATALTLW